MKNILISLFVITSFMSYSQYTVTQKTDVYIKVKNAKGITEPYVRVKLTTADGYRPQTNVTNARGNARFVVLTGKSYKVFIYDTIQVSEFSVPLNHKSYITKEVTLPEMPVHIVTKLTNDTIDQTNLPRAPLKAGEISFVLKLKDHRNRPVHNQDVRIFCKESKTAYISKTNTSGAAKFMVPGNRDYIVAINNHENYDTVSAPRFSFAKGLMYVPTKIRETERNDTVFQEHNAYMHPTSDRAFIRMVVTDHSKQYLPNEWVYFDRVGSRKVYAGKTNSNGQLTMLLPKGHSYELSFTYERNVKRLTYPSDGSLFTTKFYMRYIGTKNVEHFHANAAKDGDFRVEFMEPGAKPATMDESVIERTEHGYNLNFVSEGEILTPAVQAEKLFVSSGFYSPYIYCVNAQTGRNIWGIELAENGPSVLVVDQGMLLVNTQSCTLYAIDIETGVLAWSKWLGPSIYHSPTVANGVVYASYPNDLSMSPNRYVLAAFDIKTGDIKWQSRLKKEPVGAPVAAAGKIFITDQDGILYSFNSADGKENAKLSLNALAPPVYYNNYLWVNAESAENENTSVLNKLSPDSLKGIKEYSNLNYSLPDTYSWSMSSSERMSYSTGRLLINKGTGYLVTESGVKSFSPETGAVKWNYPVDVEEIRNPVIAGNYLISEIDTANYGIINCSTGKLYKKYSIDNPVSEPVVSNGWIYTGTYSGKIQAINTKNKSITGWNQWGMNASHNPVIE